MQSTTLAWQPGDHDGHAGLTDIIAVRDGIQFCVTGPWPSGYPWILGVSRVGDLDDRTGLPGPLGYQDRHAAQAGAASLARWLAGSDR